MNGWRCGARRRCGRFRRSLHRNGAAALVLCEQAGRESGHCSRNSARDLGSRPCRHTQAQRAGLGKVVLYTLVHSIALGQIRREKTDRRIEEVVLETREETAEDAFTADDANAIHDALDELSEKHGEILALYFLEEFSLAEIAQVCGERDSAAMVQRRVGSLTARAASCGIFFTWGDVELVKHYIDACRIDRLKEIKQIQLQLFELDTAREPSNLG